MTIRGLHILTNLLVLYAALSCNREGDEDHVQIEFTSSYKAEVVSKSACFTTGDSFGVFAYYREGDVLPTDYEPDFMNNVKVTYDGRSWGYSPEMYWPQSVRNTISFIAYGPYSDNQKDLQTGGQTGPVYVSTVPGNPPELIFDLEKAEGKADLIAAKKTASREDGSVELDFEHLLCKIDFTFKNTTEGGLSTVEKISFNNISVPDTFHFNEIDDSSLGYWGETMKTEGVSFEHDLRVIGTEDVSSGVFTTYLPEADVSGKIYLTIDGVDYQIIHPDLEDLEANKAVTIDVVIHTASIVYDVTVSDWTVLKNESGGKEVSHNIY